MKKLSSETLIGIVLLVAFGALTFISPERVWLGLKANAALAGKTLGLTVIAVAISVVIHYWVPPNLAERYLSKSELKHQLRYLFFATILGILTPGPVYAIYPIVLVLKKKGIRNPILVSYITGQTIIGPARIPFEVGLFGVEFFTFRLALSVVMGTLAGLLYILFSKILPDNE